MWPFYKLLWPAMLACALSLLTTACASTKPPIPTIATPPSQACAVWPTISYSAKQDSSITIRQIIASNAARKAVCG